MEILYSTVALLCAVFVSLHAWKILNWVWFNPKKLEKNLREQGFNGNPYRFLIGDSRIFAEMAEEALLKPITFSNDIRPRVMPFIHKSLQTYGENCFIWFGPNPTVVITNPETIRDIFAKNYIFEKTSTPIDKLLAGGIATYEMDKWTKHRRLLNPAFNLEKLKRMVPSFYASGIDMLNKWDEIVSSEGACELDVWPYLQTMSRDAVSRTAFGSNYEEGRRIFELQKEQVTHFLQALNTIYIPGWRLLPTKRNRRMKEIAKEVDSSILAIINKRIEIIEAGESHPNDLLGIMLESNFKEIQRNGDESGMKLQEVIDECKAFYIAGQETTSVLLVWTMILLSKHSDWQARAREEVLQVLGPRPIPDFQELNHLKIVTMIFHEVLRLYPPGVVLSRTIGKETKVGNVMLPAPVRLFLPALVVQQDCKIWGDDAKEFKPERFREGVSKATNGHFTYFPFGGGPRICIGQNFAMLEAKIALALILRRYSFELSPSYTHAPSTVLALQPQYGAQLILHRL